MRSQRRVATTACCQRKEPRVRSGSRMLAVCRSCRRFSRIVNVIKLKKGTIEITTIRFMIRTCKKGLTFSQSRNGCMPLMPHGTWYNLSLFVMELELSERHQPDCSRAVVNCIWQLIWLPLLLKGIFVVVYVRKQNLTQICQKIILRSESYNFMSCCPRLQSRGGWFHL